MDDIHRKIIHSFYQRLLQIMVMSCTDYAF
jgi:hypothetical protein